jgi:hypothetical protein
MLDWIITNKEWIFSGVGVFVLTFIFALIRKKNKSNTINQKAGDKSILIAGDVNAGINYNGK